MSDILRILILIGAVVFVLYILLRIQKLKLKMEDAIFWIFFGAVVAVLGTVPQVAYWLSNVLGVISPANLVFLLIIGLLIEKIFTLSVTLSMLEEKVTILSAEIAIRGRDATEGQNELKKELEEIKENIGGQKNPFEARSVDEKESV